MNAGFSAEIAVLGLSIGLLLSLVCYLVSNLSPGGMITPGWLALVVVEEPRRLALLALVVVGTIFVMLGVRRVVILYGKRLFATVVMVAVFLQMTAFFVLIDLFPSTLETTTLGFIVPGLIAYQLMRQPVVATLGAIAAVTALSYGVMLAGVVFNLVPGLVAPTFASGNIELTPMRVGFVLVATLVGFIGVGIQMRRIRRPTMAPVAGRAPRSASATREPATVPFTSPASASEPPAGNTPKAPADPLPPVASEALDPQSKRRLRVTLAVALVAVLLFGAGVVVGRAATAEDDPGPAAERDALIDPGPRGAGAEPDDEGRAEPRADVGKLEIGRYPKRCLRETGTPRDGLAVSTTAGVAIVDPRTGKIIRTGLRGEPLWSPSGRWLGVGRGRVVRREGGQPRDLFSEPVSRWTWAPRADCAVGASGGSIIVALPGGDSRVLFHQPPGTLVFSPDGDAVAVLTRDEKPRLFLADLRRGTLRTVGSFSATSELLGWSADGALVTDRGRLMHVRARNVTRLGKLRQGRLLECGGRTLIVGRERRKVSSLARGRLTELSRGYRGVTCSPDGRYLAGVSSSGGLTVLDAADGFRSRLDVDVTKAAALDWGSQGLSIATRSGRTLTIALIRPGGSTTQTLGSFRVGAKARLERLVDRVGDGQVASL
ncbi:MAG: poly-gamma-glutamate biosynthesis protein PgsC/CapC [Actinomycetota bacterium]